MKQIPLTQGKFALVDDEDFEYLSQWKWYTYSAKHHNLIYAVRNARIDGKRMQIKMHRVIMELKNADKLLIDHINHNGIDNRRSNLRICTTSENQMNSRPRKNSSSKYMGVSYYKKARKWVAMTRLNGSNYYGGVFNTEEAAAIAYNKKALELFGEFANLNIVEA